MSVKILMVCLGNICRSPLAEGILASKLPKDKFLVDSAGTGPWHVGSPPDQRSVLTAKRNGIDISCQRGKHFNSSFFNEYDYIYVMDTNIYQDVIQMAQTETDIQKVHLILEEIFPGENIDVPDPYHGVQLNFDQVFEMLDEACDSIAKKLLKK